jgi:GTP cyclohydrolase IA
MKDKMVEEERRKQEARRNKLFEFNREVEFCIARMLSSLEKWTGGKIHRYGPNFINTPERVARAYAEIFEGLFDDGSKVTGILSKTFPSKSSEMITVGPVQVWSMCPHHLLPVMLRVWISYIPNKKVLGLSKLARLVELTAKKPALQEETTLEIASLLQKGLQPKGSACLIRGRHLCMEMRGVKKDAWTTTTALEGVLKKAEARAEFLAAVRGER